MHTTLKGILAGLALSSALTLGGITFAVAGDGEIVVGAPISLTGPLAGDGKEQEGAYQQAGARSGRDDTNVEHFRTALRQAREAGAAAWTFHTRKGFRLDYRSFTSQEEAGEREFLRAH